MPKLSPVPILKSPKIVKQLGVKLDLPDAVHQSVEECARALGYPLQLLPIFVNSDPKGSMAHVSVDGIWIHEKVIKNDPANTKVYLAHEIFHWVVNNNSILHKYTHLAVNYITDFKINELLLTLYGYDVSAVKYKGLLNKKWFGLSLDEIGKKLKVNPAKGAVCSAEGMPHPRIAEAAAKLRKKHAKLLETVPELFYLTSEEEQVFTDVLMQVDRNKLVFRDYPVDNHELVKAIWYACYAATPTATKPVNPACSVEQTIVYSIHYDKIREKTVGDSTAAMFATIRLMQRLNADSQFLNFKVAGAMYKRDRLVNGEKPKTVKGKAALKVKIKEADKTLKRWQDAPSLNQLFYTCYVFARLQQQSFKPSTLKQANQVVSAIKLLQLRSNETTKRIRLLTNSAGAKIEQALNVLEEMQDQLGSQLSVPDSNEEPDQDLVDAIRQAEGKGKGNDEGDGEESAEARQGNGPVRSDQAGKEGGKSTTRLQVLSSMGTNISKIASILGRMRECETLIKQIRTQNTKVASEGVDTMYEYGNDVTRFVQSEVALLANEATKLQFLINISTNQTLLHTPAERKRQPIILMLDTSGSMSGQWYDTAAGFCLAVLKIMANEKRGVALLTFDHERGHEVIVSENSKLDMGKMLQILLNPSYGGTNFDKPLLRSQAIRDEQKWKSYVGFMVTDGFDHITQADTFNNNKARFDRLIGAVVSTNSGNALMPVADEIKHIRKAQAFELVDSARSLF